MAKTSQTSTSGLPTWSAERPETADPRTHRWQGIGDKLRRSKAYRPPRRRPRVAILFCCLIGLFSLFVYNLVFAPVKTPLVLIAATEYAAPLPPTDWTHEDLAGLKELDEKTFRVVDTSASWNTKPGGLAELDRRLKEVAGRRGNDGVVLFYVALHGAVDGEGRPCLLLPGASPWMSSEWLPLAELFDHLTELLPDDVQKVVLLDSCRIQSDWNLGTVRNTFVERVERLVDERRRSDLHVLTSAGPGERSWAAAELRGSSFGRAVKMALAGDSDRSVSAVKFGNRNGRVSAQELHRYVAAKTNTWAVRNRGVPQTPQWISADFSSQSDFRLAWTLSRGDLNRFREEEAAVTRAADVVPPDDVARLWRQLESLRKLRPYQSHPLAWRELEHGLLRLEQTTTAGEAYREQALHLQADLQRRLDDAAKRAALVGDSQSPAARASILAPQEFESIDGARLHSTAAAETFGTLSASAAETLRERYLNPALRESATSSGNTDRRPGIAPISMESEWARMTDRYRTAERWKDAEVVRTGFGLLQRAEFTAVGGDERSHYWVEPALAAAYGKVRADFDRTFIGPDDSLDRPWSESRRALDRLGPGAGTQRAEVDAAIAIRDRGAAEGVYLANWFCRANALPIDAERDVIEQRLLPWLSNLQQLSEAIDARSQSPGESLPPFVATAKTVAAELEALKAVYLKAIEERIHRTDPDAATLRELQAALELPFLAAERRAALQQKVAALAGQLHEAARKAGDAPPAETKPEPSAAQPPLASDAIAEAAPPLTNQSLRTLYEVLEIELPASEKKTKPEEATDRWTDLELRQTVIRNRLLELTTMPTTDESQLGERPRDTYSRTDRLLRSAAPLAFALPQIDAAARLRKFDLQQMLLWNCGRLLDDFWGGPSETAVQSASESRAFFDIAVGDYLIVAEDLIFPAPSVRREIEEIQRMLSRRRVGARRGGTTTVDTPAPEQAGDVVTVDVVVKPGLDASATGAAADGAWLPSGRGVVFARNAERPLPPTPGAWPVPPLAAGTRVQLSGEVPKSLGSSFEAVAMFRGNEFTAPFARPGIGGVVVDFRPTRPDTATITLFGDRPQQSSVMFILDCSASMAAEIPVELVDADRLPRLDLAKSGLNSLLEQLAVRADTRVGVRFFGHRVGWAKGESARLMTQDEYSGPIPDDLAPSADVELVLPLGRFDTVEAGLVSSRLRTTKPWGQSPLYLSLLDSLRDFDADRDDTNKSIVVITDGANYQFTPADGGASAPAHQTLNDVLTAFQGKRVPIFILGFGLEGDDSATAAARREFTTLAERTGGRFFVVENGRDLLQALRDQVSLGSYAVEASVQGGASPASIKLNTPKGVSGLNAGPAEFTVRFQSSAARVTAEGGEALELFASRDGQLTARPYDRQLPVQDVMSCDADPRRLTVRAHRPTLISDGVKFPISVQDPEAPFTPRPDEMWIEVTPVIDGRAESTPRYVFYDRKYDPSTPVPQSTWTATAWPSGAKQARIAPYYKYGRTEPFQTFPLSDVAERATLFSGGVAVRSVSGVQLRVQLPENANASDVLEIKVIEEHDARSPGVHSLKVLLETAPGLLPERIVRRYDADRGVVIHSFRFSPEIGRRVLADPASKLTLTSRSAALEGTFRIEGGRTLTVDLAGSGDLLPLDAATGVR